MRWWYENEEEMKSCEHCSHEDCKNIGGTWYCLDCPECGVNWKEKKMELYKNEDLCIECKNEFFSKPYDHRDPTPGQLGYCIKCDNCLIKEKKMEFDKSRVYTALNADELKAGDKVIVANSPYYLKKQVEEDDVTDEIMYIATDTNDKRFRVDRSGEFALAYLVERAENCTNCEGCEYKDKEWMKKNKDYLINRCENYKPKTEKKIGIEKCKTCKNFKEKFGCPYMLDCKTGWNDDYRKPDRYEPKTKKEDNMWIDKIYPMRQENGVSDHVIVAVEGCPYVQSGYYDYDMQAWFVDGCSEPVKVEAWQKVELPKIKKAEKHYRPFKDTDELVKVWFEKDKRGITNDALEMPHIWVKEKDGNGVHLIAGYTDDVVFLGNNYEDMDELFEFFMFADGSPCGVEE